MNKKIHIMHLVLSLEVGGLENGIVNLINNMDNKRFKVSVCCLEKIGELSDRIDENRKHIFIVQKDGRMRIKDVRGLARLLKEQQVDILHTHSYGTLLRGFISARLAGVPVIIHGEHGILYTDKFRRVIAQKILLRMVDCTITVSKDLQSRIARDFNVKEKLFIPIINGVDFSKFNHRQGKSSISVREELGIDDKAVLIGSIGRLVDVKNYPLLINVINEFVIKGLDIYLIIVGDGPVKVKLQQGIKDYGLNDRVFLPGRKDNIPDYLSAFDIFVLTSDFEGISNTILEAMACGVPVVATNVGGTPEIVDDGNTGLLVKPRNKNELFNSLKKLYDDPPLRQKMGESAINAIAEKFSLMRMVNEYENIYTQFYNKRKH